MKPDPSLALSFCCWEPVHYIATTKIGLWVAVVTFGFVRLHCCPLLRGHRHVSHTISNACQNQILRYYHWRTFGTNFPEPSLYWRAAVSLYSTASSWRESALVASRFFLQITTLQVGRERKTDAMVTPSHDLGQIPVRMNRFQSWYTYVLLSSSLYYFACLPLLFAATKSR